MPEDLEAVRARDERGCLRDGHGVTAADDRRVLLAEVERLRLALAVPEREADRLRHGVPVEGDFVCPDSLALTEARKLLREARTYLFACCDLGARIDAALPKE